VLFVAYLLFLGFDDDNGSYIKVLHDHIAYRYEIREVIGKGSFGQVVKVRISSLIYSHVHTHTHMHISPHSRKLKG